MLSITVTILAVVVLFKLAVELRHNVAQGIVHEGAVRLRLTACILHLLLADRTPTPGHKRVYTVRQKTLTTTVQHDQVRK